MVACRDQTQMRPMAGVKGRSMCASLLKTERMLGRLEHEEGTQTLCLVVGCFLCLGRPMDVCWEVACSSLLKNAPGRSCLAVVRNLVNALTLPRNGRGGRTPLNERYGLPVVHPVRCMVPDLQIFRESVLDSFTTQSMK